MKVKVNEQEYEVSPLKMKHLREINKLLAEQKEMKTPALDVIDRWTPFIYDCIKAKNPDFSRSEMDEMTMAEYGAAWETIVVSSGVKFIQKGENLPTATSTTPQSTDASPSAVAGPIQ